MPKRAAKFAKRASSEKRYLELFNRMMDQQRWIGEWRNIRRREMTKYPKRRICCIKQNSQEWEWITDAWNRINNFLFHN